MGFQKKTLRRLPPATRKFAKMVNEGESLVKRLKSLVDNMARLEMESQALWNQHQHQGKGEVDPASLDMMETQILDAATKAPRVPKG